MLNRITMAGRLVADPELHHTQSNIPVTSFRIANDRNFKNAQSEKETDFFNIVAWRGKAEFVCNYFLKGSAIIIDGTLQTRKYTDKEGNQREAVEIIADQIYFGESKKDGGDQAQGYESAPAPAQNYGGGGYAANSGFPPAPQFTPDLSAGNAGGFAPGDFQNFEEIINDGSGDLPFPPYNG